MQKQKSHQKRKEPRVVPGIVQNKPSHMNQGDQTFYPSQSRVLNRKPAKMHTLRKAS
jgi:hypothetical protein